MRDPTNLHRPPGPGSTLQRVKKSESGLKIGLHIEAAKTRLRVIDVCLLVLHFDQSAALDDKQFAHQERIGSNHCIFQISKKENKNTCKTPSSIYLSLVIISSLDWISVS